MSCVSGRTECRLPEISIEETTDGLRGPASDKSRIHKEWSFGVGALTDGYLFLDTCCTQVTFKKETDAQSHEPTRDTCVRGMS